MLQKSGVDIVDTRNKNPKRQYEECTTTLPGPSEVNTRIYSISMKACIH